MEIVDPRGDIPEFATVLVHVADSFIPLLISRGRYFSSVLGNCAAVISVLLELMAGFDKLLAGLSSTS
jgi:hypothetical protein